MSKNEIIEQNDSGYQITITDIKYGRELSGKVKHRPEITTLDVPESLLKLKEDNAKFMENIESFAYNMLTRKYGAEVCHCQVWLPEEN